MNRAILLLYFLLPLILLSQTERIQKIAWDISDEHYSTAFAIIDSLPDGLEKDFWLGATYVARWNDLRLQEDYEKSYKIFANLFALDTDTLNIMEKYYVAQAIGELSIRKAQEGKWLEAVSDSWKSIGLLEEVLEKMPDFADAKTGIAVFRYWVADRLPVYYWFTFHFSTKNNAIELLEEVSSAGLANKDLALQQLFWVYINEEDFSNSRVVKVKYGKRHPQSRMKLWMDYFLDAHTENDTSAFYALEKLENTYKNLIPYSKINNTEILVNKFKYAYLLNKTEAALKLRDEISGLTYSQFEKDFLKSKFELYRKICDKLKQSNNIPGKN